MNNTFEQTEILRVKYKNAYDSARKNSLFAILLTFVSIVMLLFGVSFYFSAYVPVTLMENGVYAKNMDSANYTDEELIAEGLADEVFAQYRAEREAAGDKTEYTDQQLYELGVADQVIADFRAELKVYQEETDGMVEFVINAGLSVIIAAFYLVCWLLSKKHPAWLIVLTAAYVLDTLLMIPDLFSYYLVYDIRGLLFLTLYHAWILYILINGVLCGMKLKKLPAPIEGVAVEVDPTVEAAPAEVAAPAESATAAEAAPVDTDNTPEA